MKKLILSIILAVMVSVTVTAQTTQLFTDDFETAPGAVAFALNSGGPAAAAGNNQWTINNTYSGAPTYPNTMSEDSTYSGTIGFAPYSKYLHINDAFSGITNDNFNPADVSDNFAYLTDGICTLGMDSVHFSFFYTCEGSATAYGQVYYSINSGPWVQTGLSQYKNKSKWQYEDISDPIFANKLNVRWGFRWINSSGTPPYSEAFGIDDIDIVGYYTGAGLGGITMTVDSVAPNPICAGNYLFIYWHLSDTLCDGSYQINLSSGTGVFPGPDTWVFNIYYPQTSGTVPIAIPYSTPAGTCYKIRISRTSPAPVIVGIASACFEIIHCPNVITTLQPVVTFDTNAVCIGSAIDVPFYSTGTYTFNTYTAELSDTNGVFGTSPPFVGSAFNSTTYDASLGSPPGTVSGLVPTVPPGCGYYIRVTSSSPVSTVTAWGPFCIRQCDIQTNLTHDLHFCVTDCSVAPAGEDTTIHVGINTFDTIAHYLPGNLFTTQLLSMMTFAQVGSNGIVGEVAATHDTMLHIHIPCKDSMGIYGLPVGTEYLRVVATNTTEPDDALGSLVRLTVGAPRATAEIITSINYGTSVPSDTLCVDDILELIFYPYNYSDNSTYLWQCPFINGGNPFVSPSGANSNTLFITFGGPGALPFKVQETSYGCVGPWSPIKTVYVIGPPVVSISGPSVICQGDTVHFSVPFATNTYYNWNTTGHSQVVDTANNIIAVADTVAPETFTVHIDAINQCGSGFSNKTVTVRAYPNITVHPDTTICQSQAIVLNTPSGTGYTYLWTQSGTSIGTANNVTVAPTITTSYVLQVTGPGGCKRRDTVTIQVQTPTQGEMTDSICPTDGVPITISADSAGTYSWNTGATTQQITVTDTGTYTVQINELGRACARVLTFDIIPASCLELELPNVFTPGVSGGTNDFFSPIKTGPFQKFDIKIYNRWGELLFHSSDPFFQWNGTNKAGRPVPDGVYYYICEASQSSGDKGQSLTGFIQLIR